MRLAAQGAAGSSGEVADGDSAAELGVPPTATPLGEVVEGVAKSDEYSEVMNRRMGTSLTYNHELGIDYNRILPDIIVGSCLQTAADVDRLAEQEGVTTIFCIQEDTDMAYFNLDLQPILDRCLERGDIKHVRFPIHDFDPYDLRRKLPKAVSRLAHEHNPSTGTIYIHCTAGMGRAPATALAYMNWVRGVQLDEGHKLLTSLRKCGPKIEAIRSATADLLLGSEPVDAKLELWRYGTAKQVQVAGLDFGWHAPIDMEVDPKTHNFILRRRMYPGTYQFKFILDGTWSASVDHLMTTDGSTVNNLMEVIPRSMDMETLQKQIKYLTPGTRLTADEQAELRQLLCPWASHDTVLYLPGDVVALTMMGEMQADAVRVQAQKQEAVVAEGGL